MKDPFQSSVGIEPVRVSSGTQRIYVVRETMVSQGPNVYSGDGIDGERSFRVLVLCFCLKHETLEVVLRKLGCVISKVLHYYKRNTSLFHDIGSFDNQSTHYYVSQDIFDI